jgi:uncharacterized protein YlxW (UPF0749 family)
MRHGSVRRVRAVPTLALFLGWVAGLLMFGVAQQWKVEQLLAQTETMREGQALTYLVERTTEQVAADTAELASLRAQLASVPAARIPAPGTLAAARAAAGLTAVTGPGVVVTLADSPHPTFPGEPVQMQLVHDEYVLHIVGLLMAHGATAVAIGGQRFVALSAIFCAGPTIRINNVLEGSPFAITAVGNTQAMLTALAQDPDVQGWSALIQIHIHPRAQVTVPPYDGPATLVYAKPADGV